jgi:hypothetical protein
MDTNLKRRFVSVTTALERMDHKSRTYLYDRLRSGDITAVRVGIRTLIDEDSLDAFLASKPWTPRRNVGKRKEDIANAQVEA